MSMDKLSTELDCKIARFLIGDNMTLSAFSRVSKYYHKVMEPFLYEVLSFSYDESQSLQWLLMTLLDRPELASKITSLSMYSTKLRYWSPPSSFYLNDRKWAYTQKIRSKIDEVVSRTVRGYDNAYKYEWFLKILSEESNEPDATLALILCLSPNLTSLRLNDHQDLAITMTMLGVLWRDPEAGPFTNLKELSVHNYRSGNSFLDLPPIDSMVVENIRGTWGKWTVMDQIADPLHWEPFYFPDPVVASIRSIVFVGLQSVIPIVITRMISSPSLANVKELVVKSCGTYYERTNQLDGNFNLPALVRALERYVPTLEHFEFTQSTPCILTSQFDTFSNLENLRTLAVSLNTIAHQEVIDHESFLGCRNVFPDSLEYLTLENFKVDQVSELCQQYRVEHAEVVTSSEMYLSFFESLVPKRYMKGLAIAIDMDTYGDDYHNGVLELDPEDVIFFRDMADELVNVGVEFEVFRAPGPSNMFYKLLVKPGWSAPRPHSHPGPKRPGDRLTFLVDNERLLDF